MEVSGQLHALAALSPGKETPVPLDRRLGGPQSRSRCHGLQNNILPCRESNPDRPVSSPSLCRLKYPGFYWGVTGTNSHRHIQYLISAAFFGPLRSSCVYFNETAVNCICWYWPVFASWPLRSKHVAKCDEIYIFVTMLSGSSSIHRLTTWGASENTAWCQGGHDA
jgi:hypothetical protein